MAATYVKGDETDSSFLLWKFNTRYNITEFARLGPTDVEDFSTPYERVTMVRYDAVNSQGKLTFLIVSDCGGGGQAGWFSSLYCLQYRSASSLSS